MDDTGSKGVLDVFLYGEFFWASVCWRVMVLQEVGQWHNLKVCEVEGRGPDTCSTRSEDYDIHREQR